MSNALIAVLIVMLAAVPLLALAFCVWHYDPDDDDGWEDSFR